MNKLITVWTILQARVRHIIGTQDMLIEIVIVIYRQGRD